MAVPVYAQSQEFIIERPGRQVILLGALDALLLFLVPPGIALFAKLLQAAVPESRGRNKATPLSDLSAATALCARRKAIIPRAS